MEKKVIAKEYVDKNFIHKDVIKKIRAEMYVEYIKELDKNSIRAFILKCQIEILDNIMEKQNKILEDK